MAVYLRTQVPESPAIYFLVFFLLLFPKLHCTRNVSHISMIFPSLLSYPREYFLAPSIPKKYFSPICTIQSLDELTLLQRFIDPLLAFILISIQWFQYNFLPKNNKNEIMLCRFCTYIWWLTFYGNTSTLCLGAAVNRALSVQCLSTKWISRELVTKWDNLKRLNIKVKMAKLGLRGLLVWC